MLHYHTGLKRQQRGQRRRPQQQQQQQQIIIINILHWMVDLLMGFGQIPAQSLTARP